MTDQRLVSPAVVLPTGQNPVVLKFQHVPNLETATTGCFDAGILEVSADSGGSWTQVPSANLLVGDYTGSISSSWGNPLGGLQGWCGPNTTTYQPVVADVSGYTGQTVQFRWRIGTDSSVSRPGWDVDNVSVQSCQAAIAAILDPASDVTVLPGETAVHQFTLSNLGLDDVYDLAISGGNWSTTLQTSSPVTLTGGSSAIITVAVETPMLAGSDSFTLTVTSQSDPNMVLTAEGTTHTATFAAALTALSIITVQPGELVTHQFVLTNLDFDDVYELSISDANWSTTLQTSSPIAISAGMTSTIDVSVETPMLLGSDSFTLTVTSQGDPNLVLTAVGTTHTEATYAAALTALSDITVQPGELVTHQFVLTNLDFDDVYELSISDANWSTTLQTSSPIAISAGMTATIDVSVETPVLLGSDSFTLTVTSQADPNLVLTAVGTTYTEVDAGMIISGDSELWGTAGLTITHMIAITNSGALTDTFTLEILDGHTWTTWSDQAEVGPLAPGATVQFAIHVLVGSGAADTATLRIKSGWDTTIYRDVQITTRTHLVFLPMSLKQ